MRFPLAAQFPWLAKNSVGPNYNMGTTSYNGLQTQFQRRFSKGLTASFSFCVVPHYDLTLELPAIQAASPQDLGFGTAPAALINPLLLGQPSESHEPNHRKRITNRASASPTMAKMFTIVSRGQPTTNYRLASQRQVLREH